MPAYTGRQGKVKIAAATATATTGEAFTGVSTSTDIALYRITDTAKRHWLRTSTPTIYRDTTAVGSTEFAVNYVTGEVTFTTAQTTARTMTADVSYLATSYLGQTKGWELEIETDQLDVTTLSTTTGDTAWRSFQNGISMAAVTLDRIVVSSTAVPFYDRLNADQSLLVELIVTDDDKFEAFANVEGDNWESMVDALASESVTLKVDGQVSFSTY